MPELKKLEASAAYTPADGKIVEYFAEENGQIVLKVRKSDGTEQTLSGGGGGGSSMDFYKCAAVYGPKNVSGFIVAGAGTTAVNGNYTPTELTTEDGGIIYKHETAEYYYIEMWGEKGICSSPTDYPSSGLYYNMYDEGWQVGTGTADAPTVTAGTVTINADVPKTWDGFKAVLTDGVYAFEATATTGLTYGNGFTPGVGVIYTADALVIVSKLYASAGRSVITIVAPRDTGVAGTYKQVEGTEYGTKGCVWLQNPSQGYSSRGIRWGTSPNAGSYGDDDYAGVEGWHVCDYEDGREHKVWLGDGDFPTAPTHWDANSTLTESFEEWE